MSYADVVTLQWDPVEEVDGYYIYKVTEHPYDFSDPVKTEEYPDGKIPQDITTISIDLTGPTGEDTEYFFTAKSFRGDQTSEPSNEVSHIVCMVPPEPPSDLQGEYNKEQGLVTVSWEQSPEAEAWRQISHWIIYYKVEGENWIPIGRINSDHALTMEAPLDAVQQGERKNVDFVIVAYRNSGIYSQNSAVLTVDIDRRAVPPIQNLRLTVEIPLI